MTEHSAALEKLTRQVDAIVKESGTPEGFDAAEWVHHWIEQPAAALGGVRPVELLGTAEGQVAVSKILTQMQSSVYA